MLDKLLADHRTGQDATQLGSFVLGGRTQWGTYKQAVRELYKRIRGLRQMITERDLLLIDIEETEEKVLGTDRDSRRAGINLRSMRGQLEESERCIADTKREAALFFKVANEIKGEIGEIDEIQRAELDRAEWKWWHFKRAAISKLTTGRIDDTTLKNLCSLPFKERTDWLATIKDDQTLIEHLEQSEYGRIENFMPSPNEIRMIEQEISKCE